MILDVKITKITTSPPIVSNHGRGCERDSVRVWGQLCVWVHMQLANCQLPAQLAKKRRATPNDNADIVVAVALSEQLCPVTVQAADMQYAQRNSIIKSIVQRDHLLSIALAVIVRCLALFRRLFRCG